MATNLMQTPAYANAATAGEMILEYIRRTGAVGATDDQISIALGLSNSTVRHSRRALADAGKVQDTGRTRRTSEGRLARVWRYTRPAKAVKVVKAAKVKG